MGWTFLTHQLFIKLIRFIWDIPLALYINGNHHEEIHIPNDTQKWQEIDVEDEAIRIL